MRQLKRPRHIRDKETLEVVVVPAREVPLEQILASRCGRPAALSDVEDLVLSGVWLEQVLNTLSEEERLIREWDERLLDPLVISFRDGKFNVVDGQHRVAAMRKMNGGKEVMAPCVIYSGLTYEQEADLCYKLDRAKKRLTLAQATNALAESSADEDIRTVKSLIEANGFVWALNRRTRGANEIGSVRALMRSWRALGSEEFSRMLAYLRSKC